MSGTIEYAVQKSTVPSVWEFVGGTNHHPLDLPTARAFVRGARNDMLDGSWRVVEAVSMGQWQTREEASALHRQPDTLRPAWAS